MANTVHCEGVLIDLACDVLGGAALACSDEFFAPRHNLVRASAPIFLADKYVETGKWMDGWESRRRTPGDDDWCLLRLGLRGTLETIVVDTSHFTGNFPASCLIEAVDVSSTASLDELLAAEWVTLVEQMPLSGDSKNRLACKPHGPVSHLRLRIFPDGGVARLRALGTAAPDWDYLDGTGSLVDLVAVENGGRVLGCSDDHYGLPINLILPDRARDMSEGWETRRRRGEGHDWAAFELGAAGRLFAAEIDTSCFRGNAPTEFSLEGTRGTPGEIPEGGWTTLIGRRALRPHSRHRFVGADIAEHSLFTHVRLRIFPDGGLSRMRLWGRTESAERLLHGLFRLNAAAEPEAIDAFTRMCGSKTWAEAMARGRPYLDVATLERHADSTMAGLEQSDWLEAFAAHPRIGASKAAGWAAGEQSGVSRAEPGSLDELAQKNDAYLERFGFIFIVCATGKSAEEMLAMLTARLENDRDTEIVIAAAEQRKITHLRMQKWLKEAP